MADDLPANRLERMLARLSAQRDYLRCAIALSAEVPGVVLELGLGKGRTFDYLRQHALGRAIFAFDLTLHAPPAVTPAPERLLLGPFAATLPAFHRQYGACCALVHADFGSEDATHDAEQARVLAPLLAPLLHPGALVVSDRPLDLGMTVAAAPATAWRYYLRRTPG